MNILLCKMTAYFLIFVYNFTILDINIQLTIIVLILNILLSVIITNFLFSILSLEEFVIVGVG